MPSPLHGQVAVSGVAQALSAVAISPAAFTIKAPASNASPVYIGASTVTSATGYQLDPGDELGYERISQNGQPVFQLGPSDFYVVGTVGDKVAWLSSP